MTKQYYQCKIIWQLESIPPLSSPPSLLLSSQSSTAVAVDDIKLILVHHSTVNNIKVDCYYFVNVRAIFCQFLSFSNFQLPSSLAFFPFFPFVILRSPHISLMDKCFVPKTHFVFVATLKLSHTSSDIVGNFSLATYFNFIKSSFHLILVQYKWAFTYTCASPYVDYCVWVCFHVNALAVAFTHSITRSWKKKLSKSHVLTHDKR